MLALVLGGNGFIGSHIVDQLLDDGHRVRVFDRGPEKFRSPLSSVDYFTGEFSNTAMLAEALNDVDVVYHLISTTVPSTSNMDPAGDITGNLINTVKLLETMRLQEVKQIVYLSSGGTVYGIPEVSPIKESHPLRPISSYGVVKVAIENYLHMFYDLYGIKYSVLRASNPYGARQGHAGLQGVIGTYISRLSDGLDIEVWGTGEIVRDFIHVDDLASLCLKAGTSSHIGVFNAGYGEGVSILDIVDLLSECTGIDITPVLKSGRAFDVPHIVLDISKTSKTYNWEPRISLREGIELTLNSHNEIDRYKKVPLDKAA